MFNKLLNIFNIKKERSGIERRSGFDRRDMKAFETFNVDRLIGIIEENKQLQEALIKQDSMKFTILDAIPLPFYYKNSDGYYKGCNESFADLVGYKKKHILKSKAPSILTYEDALLIERADEVLLTSEDKVQVFKAKDFCGKDVVFSRACFKEADNTYGILGIVLEYNTISNEINPPY